MAHSAEPESTIPQLETFELGPLLARGGMGQVFRATHTTSGTPVAIKVVTRAASARHVAAIHREVRRMARLDHPSILRIHDHGRVPDGLDGLDAGMPWFAMDLADRGCLQQAPPSDWPTLASALEQVLRALAHAHARGIVHLDLKPGNLLATSSGRVLLTDFGIAAAMHEEVGRHGGTPATMAPEQIAGSAVVGPWTDLYALGCTVWWLATGSPPFRGARDAVLGAHLAQRPGAFEPRFAVPPGLAGWIRGLLEKAPADRPQRAAQALRTLAEIGGHAPTGGATVEDALDNDTSTWMGGALFDAPAAEPAGEGARATRWAPPLPPVPGPRGLPDCGGSLTGLRHPPLVGRREPWGVLTGALERVHSLGRPEVVVLHGPRGVGASWLARHFTEAVDEQGVAMGIRCDDLEQLRSGLERVRAGGEPDIHGLATGLEQAVALSRRLEWLAGRELLVVAIEAPAPGDLLSEVLTRSVRQGVPVLWIVAGHSESVPTGATMCALTPLDRTETRELVDAMAQLTTPTLVAITDCVVGRPGWVVPLLDSLWRAGRLRPTPEGAALEESVLAGISADMLGAEVPYEATETADDRSALELAAALGERVRRDVWSAACGSEAVALAERLERSGVWTPVEEGWIWEGSLRHVVEARCRENGSWAERCRTCAMHAPSETADEQLAVAMLLLDAGLAEAADPWIQRALAAQVRDEDHAGSLRAALAALRMLDERGADPRDPAYARMLGQVVYALDGVAWHRQLAALGERWLALPGVREGEHALSVHAWQARLEGCRARGEHAEARLAAERVWALDGVHQVLEPGRAGFLLARGIHDDPAEFSRALELYAGAEAVAVPRLRVACLYYASTLHEALGDDQAALDTISRAVELLETARVRPSYEALVRAAYAGLCAARGDLDAAVTGWRFAVDLLERLGHLSAPLGRLNLARFLLQTGDVDAARRHAAKARRDLERDGRAAGQACAAAVQLNVAAHEADEVAVVEHLDGLAILLDHAPVAEPDIPGQLEAAAAAMLPGDARLAERILQLAETCWLSLDRAEEAERVGRTRAALTSA